MKIKTISLIDLKEAYEKLNIMINTKKINEKEVSIFVRELLSEVNIRIYHPYDKEDFYIRVTPENHKLKDLMKIINNLENLIKQKGANTTFIKKIDETNSFIYGKINIELCSLEIDGISPGISAFAVITLSPYEFKTKTSMAVEQRKISSDLVKSKNDVMSLSFTEDKSDSGKILSEKKESFNNILNLSSSNILNSNSVINYNLNDAGNNNSNNNKLNVNMNTGKNSKFEFFQIFILPVHNKFEKLKIEVYTKNLQGVFAKREIDEKISEHEILIPDIMNTFCFGDEKMQISLENKIKNMKGGKTLINIKLLNSTSILSNFTKNRNKNVLEDMSFEKSDEDLSIKKLFKRLRKILILIKDFKEYYKTIFRFKYPNFSYLFMFLSIIYFIFFDIRYFLVHLLFLMFVIAFFYSHFYRKYFSSYVNEYIYGFKNKLDFSGDNNNLNTAMTRIELEDSEIKKESYLTDKGQKPNLIKIIIEPIKTYKNIRDSYQKVLIKFTRYVSNLEKLKNLFLFTDPILSMYFMAMLILAILVIYGIKFKYLMLFVIVKKFLVGHSYYKNKHINNLEIANIVLKHCHQEYKYKLKSTINPESHIKSALNNFIQNCNENGLNLANFNSYPNNSSSLLGNSSYSSNNLIYQNNKNENKEIVEFEDIEEKVRQIKNSENMVISHDIDNVVVFEDKFRIFIKDQLEKHIDLVLNNEFLNSISKMGEIKEVIGKCKGILKIKKDSILFNKTINNQKLYRESLDADQIFIYFIQNVKSDFYISRNYSLEDEAEKE